MSRLGHVTTTVVPRSLGRQVPRTILADFDHLVDERYLIPHYQPVFDLASGEQIGVEALARWPALRITPDEAFRWATEEGRLAELDEACRNAAIGTVLARNFPTRVQLFVNLEPSVLGPDTASRLLDQAGDRIGLVVEITERALMDRPAELLLAVHQLREAGCLIALDDVGSVPHSLAMLPFIAPDVIKLDISLIHRWPDVARAEIYTSVAAYAERTGAVVLAEGIETETHLRRARALGATLGQGWYLGWPGPLGTLAPPSRALGVHRRVDTVPTDPFRLVDPATARVGTTDMLFGISRQLEHQGLTLETPPVVLAAMQHVRSLGPATTGRYVRLGQRCPMVVVLGEGMPASPGAHVRGMPLDRGDPLRRRWVVAVVGTHYAGALIARDLGDTGGPDGARRFAFILTHRFDVVVAAAQSLLIRVTQPGAFPTLSTPSHRQRDRDGQDLRMWTREGAA